MLLRCVTRIDDTETKDRKDSKDSKDQEGSG